MVSQIYTFLSNNRSQPEISKLQGKPVIYDQNTRRFWKPEAVLFGDFSAEFGTYRLYLGEDAGEWTGLFTQLGVRNQPRPIDDYVRLLAEISQRFGSKPLDEAEAGLVYNAYNRLSAVISGLPEGGGTPDWLKPLPGLPLVLNEQRLLEPGNTLFFKDRPELLEKFPGQAVHTALYSDEKVYPLLHRLGVRALSQSVSRDLLKIDNGKLDYNSTNRLQALKSQFQRIKAHYERRKQKGWRSQDWLAAVKVFQASSIQVQYRLKYSNLVLTGVSEETTAIFDEANKTLYVSNLQQQDVTLAIARELVSLLNPGADPASLTPLLEKLLDTELSKTDLVLDRYEIDRLDGNPPPVLNKSAGPKFGVLKGPDEPLQAAIDFNEAAKPAASVPPPVRPKDTQLKFKDVKLENIAGSEPEPSTDSLSEFTAGNSALPTKKDTPALTSSAKPANNRLPQGSEPPGLDIEASNPVPSREFAVQTDEEPTAGGPGAYPLDDDWSEEPNEQDLPAQTASEPKKGVNKPPSPDNKKGVSGLVYKKQQEQDASLNIPAFLGQTRPRVPYIPTDYSALRQRFGQAAQQAGALSVEAMRSYEAADPGVRSEAEQGLWGEEADEAIQDLERVDEVRFVLSFMMRYEGFLPLTRRATALLDGKGSQIRCSTDFGFEFPLYIDRREKRIYNQQELPQFLAAQGIPAGGVIYLSRVPDGTFRLFYKSQPHKVQNVRLAELDENGQVVYSIVPEMDVPCEIEAVVFKADKRLEEPAALFKEAQTKRSVFETMIDIFDSLAKSGQKKLLEDEIYNLVFNIRMVTRRAVMAELHRRACFIEHGQGSWSFDASRIFEQSSMSPVPDLPAGKPAESAVRPGYQPIKIEYPDNQPTSYAAAPPPDLEQNLSIILEQLEELSDTPTQLVAVLQRTRADFMAVVSKLEDLYRRLVDRTSKSVPVDENTFGRTVSEAVDTASYYLDQLKTDINNQDAAEAITEILREMFSQWVNQHPAEHPDLNQVLKLADEVSWEMYVRPQLDRQVKLAVDNRKYIAACALLELDSRYTAKNRHSELKVIQSRQEAYELFLLCDGSNTAEDEVKSLIDVLSLDPDLKEARRMLDKRLLAYLAPRFKAVEAALAGEKLPELSTLFEDLCREGSIYRPHMNNFEALDAPLNKMRRKLLDLALKITQQPAHLSSIDPPLALARFYLTLPEDVLRKNNGEDYFKALLKAGQLYSTQPDKGFEAVLILSKSLKWWQGTAISTWNKKLLLEVRQQLALNYERLELWDYCHVQRREIITICSPEVRQQAQAAMAMAEEKRGSQVNNSGAHYTWLNWLHNCQRDCPELTAAVGSSFVYEQLQLEQKWLSYAG